MLRSTIIAIASAALAFSLGSICHAGDEDSPLTIGDKAPAIDIGHWIKGEEIEKFKEGNVYVMEFWATWCPPCVAAMPHLSELQEKYKDYGVTFIGISDESLETVTTFLAKTYKGDGKINDDRTHYTLTTDPDESVWKDYFRAAGQTGIPCTFIIGKTGQIEFIGHPMQMDDALEAVVRDTWDRETFKKEYEAEMISSRLETKAFKAARAEEWYAALGYFDEMIKLDPNNINAYLSKCNSLLTGKKDYDAAYGYSKKVIKKFKNNANVLNTLAWAIVGIEDLEDRFIELAMDATKKSNKLTKFKNPSFIDTLAAVYYKQGNLNKAVKWQEKAAELASDGPMGEGIRETLEEYRAEANKN